jgi:hypothetical protein
MTAKKKARIFVKSADTKASAANSRAAVEALLRRYGAVGFSVAQEMDNGLLQRVVCEFVVPDTLQKDASKVPVRLPVDVRRIYDVLYGRPMTSRWSEDLRRYVHTHNLNGYDARKMEQAERVAWRNLVLWIDAALSAVVAGLQTVTEAFLAHTLVVNESGRALRMADYLDEVGGALAPGVRALLASPAEVDDG